MQKIELSPTATNVTIVEITKWHDDETDTAFVRNRDPNIRYFKNGLLMAAAKHNHQRYGFRLQCALRKS